MRMSKRAASPRKPAGLAEQAAPYTPRPSMVERLRARENAPKRPVNLTANSAYLDEAKRLGLNLSEVFGTALKQAVDEASAAAFEKQNAAFIAWYNKEIEENGLWCDEFRTF